MRSEKLRSKRVTGILITCLILSAVITTFLPARSANYKILGSPSLKQLNEISASSYISKALTQHDPIYINGDENFTAANGVVSGSGTKIDPYIIENWDINASSAHGIHIENTIKYFIIRNCMIHDGYDAASDIYNFGIYLYNVSPQLIKPHATIDNVTSYNNYYGIFLYWYSDHKQITNCTVYNNSFGIVIGYSSNNTLRNNTLENNKYNFWVVGYDLWHFYQDIDTGNTVNSKPIYYITEQSNLVFNESMSIGYLGLVSCSNISVENLDLYGVLLANTSYSTVANISSHNSREGVYFSFSSNNTITNSTLHNNSWGACFEYSSNNQITRCVIYNNTDGSNFFFSSNNNVTNCDVYNNSYGIYLYYSVTDNIITYCDLFNNTNYGIYIYYDFDYPSNQNNFHHNNLINNGQNAYDPHTNYWDDGTYGNYWDDYTGTDTDGDGIGNTPYNIPGGGSNQDHYPLMNPIEHIKLTITLEKSWNFVSLLIINKTISNAKELANLIGENCAAIAHWDNSLDRFVTYPVGTNISNFMLPRAVGYFVYVTNETQFSMQGFRMINRTMSLSKGWSSIGCLNQTETNASVLASKIINCTRVAKWNGTTLSFDIYAVDNPASDFVIKYGEGCLVYLT